MDGSWGDVWMVVGEMYGWWLGRCMDGSWGDVWMVVGEMYGW